MGFLNILIEYFNYIQRNGPETALQYITSVMNDYVNLKLPIDYYRRFRSSNDYLLNTYTGSYSLYFMEDNIQNKRSINISHNFNILRTMHIYVSQLLYEEKMRK